MEASMAPIVLYAITLTGGVHLTLIIQAFHLPVLTRVFRALTAIRAAGLKVRLQLARPVTMSLLTMLAYSVQRVRSVIIPAPGVQLNTTALTPSR